MKDDSNNEMFQVVLKRLEQVNTRLSHLENKPGNNTVTEIMTNADGNQSARPGKELSYVTIADRGVTMLVPV